MSEDPCVHETIGELNRLGSNPPKPNPTTEHVVLQRSIELIMDLRDKVAKLRRTVAAQAGCIGEIEAYCAKRQVKFRHTHRENTHLRNSLKRAKAESAQELSVGGGITDDLLCRFGDMLKRAYPRRGQDESVESWQEKIWAFYAALDAVDGIGMAVSIRARHDHKAAGVEFDQTIRDGGLLRKARP